MCGIGAIMNSGTIYTDMKTLLSGQKSRGGSSTGMAGWINGHINLCRALVSPDKFDLNNKKITPLITGTNPRMLIGHNRAPSTGDVTLANAHPFISCNGDWMLVHNGMSRNAVPVGEILKLRGHTILGTTDTEPLLHIWEEILIHAGGDSDKAIKEYYAFIDKVISASFAIILMHKDDMMYVLREGNPAVIFEKDNTVYVASEEDAIKDFGGKGSKYSELNRGTIAKITPERGVEIMVGSVDERTVGSHKVYYNDYYQQRNGVDGDYNMRWQGGGALDSFRFND